MISTRITSSFNTAGGAQVEFASPHELSGIIGGEFAASMEAESAESLAPPDQRDYHERGVSPSQLRNGLLLNHHLTNGDLAEAGALFRRIVTNTFQFPSFFR